MTKGNRTLFFILWSISCLLLYSGLICWTFNQWCFTLFLWYIKKRQKTRMVWTIQKQAACPDFQRWSLVDARPARRLDEKPSLWRMSSPPATGPSSGCCLCKVQQHIFHNSETKQCTMGLSPFKNCIFLKFVTLPHIPIVHISHNWRWRTFFPAGVLFSIKTALF